MLNDILTPEEVRECVIVSSGRDSARTAYSDGIAQHAALMGARKALTELFERSRSGERVYAINVEYFRDTHYPLLRPARVPRKYKAGGDVIWYDVAKSEWVREHFVGLERDLPVTERYSGLWTLAYHLQLTDPDIAAIASLPDNPWEDSK